MKKSGLRRSARPGTLRDGEVRRTQRDVSSLIPDSTLQKGDSKLYQRWVGAGASVLELKRAVQFGTPLTRETVKLWLGYSRGVLNSLERLREETKKYLVETLDKEREKRHERGLRGAGKKTRR